MIPFFIPIFMRKGERDRKKEISLAWTLLIAILPFVVLLLFSNNETVMRVFLYLANVTYYTIFFIWGLVASLLGNFITKLHERKGLI